MATIEELNKRYSGMSWSSIFTEHFNNVEKLNERIERLEQFLKENLVSEMHLGQVNMRLTALEKYNNKKEAQEEATPTSRKETRKERVRSQGL